MSRPWCACAASHAICAGQAVLQGDGLAHLFAPGQLAPAAPLRACDGEAGGLLAVVGRQARAGKAQGKQAVRGRAVGGGAVAVHTLTGGVGKGACQQPVAAIQRQRAAPGVGRQARADFKLLRRMGQMHQAEPAAKAPMGGFDQGQQGIADFALGMRLPGLGNGVCIGRHGALGAPDAGAFVLAVEGLHAGDELPRYGRFIERVIVHQLGAHARVLVHVNEVGHVMAGKFAQAQPGAGMPGRRGRGGAGHALTLRPGPVRHGGRRGRAGSNFQKDSKL